MRILASVYQNKVGVYDVSDASKCGRLGVRFSVLSGLRGVSVAAIERVGVSARGVECLGVCLSDDLAGCLRLEGVMDLELTTAKGHGQTR